MLVSVYIRKADEDKWRKLPNKTEAISKLLNLQPITAVVHNNFKPGEIIPFSGTVQHPTLLCKIHGTPLTDNGKCLQKGCKYRKVI